MKRLKISAKKQCTDKHRPMAQNREPRNRPTSVQFCSVQFSRSVVSKSLKPHGLQHARPPCPPKTTRVYPNSGPLGQ